MEAGFRISLTRRSHLQPPNFLTFLRRGQITPQTLIRLRPPDRRNVAASSSISRATCAIGWPEPSALTSRTPAVDQLPEVLPRSWRLGGFSSARTDLLFEISARPRPARPPRERMTKTKRFRSRPLGSSTVSAGASPFRGVATHCARSGWRHESKGGRHPLIWWSRRHGRIRVGLH